MINNNSGFGQGWPNIQRQQGNKPGDVSELVRFGPTNFADVAKVFGLRGISVEDPAQIAPALRDALASDETVVVDVATESIAARPNPGYRRAANDPGLPRTDRPRRPPGSVRSPGASATPSPTRASTPRSSKPASPMSAASAPSAAISSPRSSRFTAIACCMTPGKSLVTWRTTTRSPIAVRRPCRPRHRAPREHLVQHRACPGNAAANLRRLHLDYRSHRPRLFPEIPRNPARHGPWRTTVPRATPRCRRWWTPACCWTAP